MGELSLRWSSRHGFPRSHRGKSHHPQRSRYVLSCTRPRRGRTDGVKDQEVFHPAKQPLDRLQGPNPNLDTTERNHYTGPHSAVKVDHSFAASDIDTAGKCSF